MKKRWHSLPLSVLLCAVSAMGQDLSIAGRCSGLIASGVADELLDNGTNAGLGDSRTGLEAAGRVGWTTSGLVGANYDNAPLQLAVWDPYGSSTPYVPLSFSLNSPTCRVYLRTDYFRWWETERAPLEQEVLHEQGLLLTLGYERRGRVGRGRIELFGGGVDYTGGAMMFTETGALWIEPTTSKTNYLGLRAEIECLIEVPTSPETRGFFGVGTRDWARSIQSTTTAGGWDVPETNEYWWTLYPYAGAEGTMSLNSPLELFYAMRIGLVAYTYESAPALDVVLHPRAGPITDLEVGLRGSRFTLTAYVEWMQWGRSADVEVALLPGMTAHQPESSMLTAGMRLSYKF